MKYTPGDIKDWSRSEITKFFMSHLAEMSEDAARNVQDAVFNQDFHSASRWQGYLDGVRVVLEAPDKLAVLVKEASGEDGDN